MVVNREFSVQLVDAITKQPFKEHRHDGKVYVEVEPGSEYYIQVKVDNTFKGGKVYAEFFVDGKDLDYHATLSAGESPRLHGLYSYSKGTSTKKSLKFEQPNFLTDAGKHNPTRALIGKVTVVFSKAIYKGTRPKSNVTPPRLAPEAVTKGCEKGLEKKVVQSSQGSRVKSWKAPTKTHCYARGNYLAGVTLQYCTALGLDLFRSSTQASGLGRSPDA